MTASISPRTVIEAFLPLEGAVPLALVYDTANAVGVADQPVRLMIRRLIAAGEVVQRGRGRAGVLALTDTGRARLRTDRVGLHLAFAQDAGLAPWDGLWRLVAVSAPETERAARDLLRKQLAGLGAAPVSTGLWLTPHDLDGLLPSEASPYVVSAVAQEVSVRGISEPALVAETLWPAAPIVAAYARLGEEMTDADAPSDAAPSAGSIVARRLRLAESLERALRDDPLIPAELRGSPWAPARQRERWLELWNHSGSSPEADALYRGWLPV